MVLSLRKAASSVLVRLKSLNLMRNVLTRVVNVKTLTLTLTLT